MTMAAAMLFDHHNNTTHMIATVFLAFWVKGVACLPLCTWLLPEKHKFWLIAVEMAILIANRTTSFLYLQNALLEASFILLCVVYAQGLLALEHYQWVKTMQQNALKVAENFGSHIIDSSEKLDGGNTMVV